jgi:hypothetical protein
VGAGDQVIVGEFGNVILHSDGTATPVDDNDQPLEHQNAGEVDPAGADDQPNVLNDDGAGQPTNDQPNVLGDDGAGPAGADDLPSGGAKCC